MPKTQKPKSNLLRSLCNEFKCFKEDQGILFCVYCCVEVKFDRRSQVVQHLNTAKHNRLKASSLSQPIVRQALTKQQCFCKDLASMLVEADIPVKKLDRPEVRQFFSKYMQHDLPSESTIRKTFIPQLYEDKLESVRNTLKDEFIWVAVDETTDTCGRCVTNVFAGKCNFM